VATKTATHYELLEVPETAEPEMIRKAFMGHAKTWHPDRAPEEERPKFEAKFKQLSQAYEVLSDPEERRRYDRELRFKQRLEGARVRSGAPEPTTSGDIPRYERPSPNWEAHTWTWDGDPVNPTRPQAGAIPRVVTGAGAVALVVGLVMMLVMMVTFGLIGVLLGGGRRHRRRW